MGNETSCQKDHKSQPSINEFAETKYNAVINPPQIMQKYQSVSFRSSQLLKSSQTISSTTKPKPQKSEKSAHRRNSVLLNVQNGITGKFISSRICKIAAVFWKENIENMSVSEQIEIGCSIFFSILTNINTKNIVKRKLRDNKNIKATSLKYLDMMGWLIRHLITDNIDLYALLIRLGVFHSQMGVNINHYTPMLQALHQTLSYYFPTKYNIEVKYALDEIFSLTAQVMTGQNLKCNAHLNDITKQFQASKILFLKDLRNCLLSTIGRDYLYLYLAQTWCDEIVIFLQSLKRFKILMTDKERFFVAKDITKISIDENATFTLNLSYATRKNAMYRMVEKEKKFISGEQMKIGTDFFIEVEVEVYKLIMDNHWNKFVQQIEKLQLKSFYVD